MDLQPLYEVKERLERAAVAGTGLLGEDFRLKRALENLAPLAAASPVFGKISAALEGLLSAPPEKRGGALLDALALVDAVVYTQASTGLPGDLEPLPPGTGTCQDASYSQLHPLLEALTGIGGGRKAVVQEAFQAHPEYFSDYRVLPALIAGLGDSYGELADLNAEILGRQGPGVAPLLEEGFDPAGGRAMARRVEVLDRAAGAQANDFFLAQLPQAKKEVRLALIGALGHSPANAQLLLELCQRERKGEALDRARCALLQLNTPEAVDYLSQLVETEPDAMLGYLANTSSQAGSRFTAMIFNRILDQMEADPGSVLPQETWQRLRKLCQELGGKTGEEVTALYRRIAALSQVQLDRKVEGEKGKAVTMRFSCYNGELQGSLRLLSALALTWSVRETGDQALCRLAIQLQAQVGEDFLAPALAARLVSQSPEESYAWAEKQLFRSSLLGTKLRQEAVPAFGWVLRELKWDDEAEVYWFMVSYSNRLGQVIHGPVSVRPLDGRWFDLLLRAGGGLDGALGNLLLNRRELPASPEFPARLYRAAQRMSGYPLQQIIAALNRLGWTDWDGFAVRWTQAGGRSAAYWDVTDVLSCMPVPPEEKVRQLKEVDRLVAQKRVKFSGGWPSNLIQVYAEKWELAAQRKGEADHV